LEQTDTKLSTRPKRKFWLFLICDLIIGLLIAAMSLILLHHQPADYNPPSLLDTPNEVNPYFTHVIMPAFYNGIQSGKPFTIIIDEKPLNDAIIACGWPQAYDSMLFSTPVVFFTKNRITGMCRINYNGIDTVITAAVSPQFKHDGKLALSLQTVRAGALALTLLVKPIASRMYNSHMEMMQGKPDLYSTIMGSILAEKPFDPVIVMGKHKARITNIQIDKRTAKITLVPII